MNKIHKKLNFKSSCTCKEANKNNVKWLPDRIENEAWGAPPASHASKCASTHTMKIRTASLDTTKPCDAQPSK